MAAEIIAVVERRRKWPAEEKLRIMSEALLPGAVASAVADRNGVCRSLLYTWLRLARHGGLPGISLAAPKMLPNSQAATSFAPVTVEPAPSHAPSLAEAPVARSASPHTACAPACARRRTTSIEVALGNGRTLKADESIDPAVLARLVAALDGTGS